MHKEDYYRQGNQPAHLAFAVVSNNLILIESILNWLYVIKFLKGMVRPENFYPPLERAQKNMQEHVFGSFLSRLEVGPI